MKNKIFLFITIILLSFSFANANTTLQPYTRTILPNGLTVIIKEVHTIPIVSVMYWCDTGSANESTELNGISHFLEHMFFKGTEKRGVGEMDLAIKRLGGRNNAATSYEYTQYEAYLISSGTKLAIEILTDAIFYSTFEPNEIEKERQVIYEEINQYLDKPNEILWNIYTATVFDGCTQYEQSILGKKEILDNFTQETFLNYLHTWYVSNNLTLVIVGDVNTIEIINYVLELTKDFKPNPEIDKLRQNPIFTPQTEIREIVREMDIDQVYLKLGFPISGRAEAPEEIYIYDVLNTILGDGRNSRLYQRLVKTGLATSAWASTFELSQGGTMYINTTLPDTTYIEEVKQIILEEFTKLLSEPVSDEELKRAKMILRTGYAFYNETTAGMCETLGWYEIIYNDASFADTYIDKINIVSAEDIQEFVKKYFNPKAYTFAIVKPKSNQEE